MVLRSLQSTVVSRSTPPWALLLWTVCRCTRSGNIDPAIIDFLAEHEGIDAHEVINILNKKSGMLGISGVSSDFRDLDSAIAEGNVRAALAKDMFNLSVKKIIGSFIAAMGGVDAIVFTAGVGEN
ncbi:MAG: hypothetical protein KHY27_09640, partial [Butyricicoccus pullicaecorum]|nr:hypothetical protein [Butyricicoccus pullicaecorum]